MRGKGYIWESLVVEIGEDFPVLRRGDIAKNTQNGGKLPLMKKLSHLRRAHGQSGRTQLSHAHLESMLSGQRNALLDEPQIEPFKRNRPPSHESPHARDRAQQSLFH